jgi:hypothetical protein
MRITIHYVLALPGTARFLTSAATGHDAKPPYGDLSDAEVYVSGREATYVADELRQLTGIRPEMLTMRAARRRATLVSLTRPEPVRPST